MHITHIIQGVTNVFDKFSDAISVVLFIITTFFFSFDKYFNNVLAFYEKKSNV